MDLPVEILFDTFEQLELNDLLSLARAHPQTRDVVKVLIKKDISNITVKSRNRFENKIRFYYGNNRSSLLDFKSKLYFFRTFGHYITNLVIDGFVGSDEQVKVFKRYISQYCAAYLKEIDFTINERWENNPLADFTSPFTQVKRVRFQRGRIAVAVNLPKLFPRLVDLDVESMSIATLNLMVHFPYLKRLIIPRSWLQYKVDFPLLNTTLQKNPQIKHLSIPQCNWTAVQLLNELRPDLDSLDLMDLTIDESHDRSPAVQFPNMKKLKCIVGGFQGIVRMTEIRFESGNLEEIEFNFASLINHWIRVALRNQNLKKITTHNFLTSDNLLRIQSKLRNLEEINFNFSMELWNPDRFVRFMMGNNGKLRKVSFNNHDSFCGTFSIVVASEWDNIENSLNKCAFVKKSIDGQ